MRLFLRDKVDNLQDFKDRIKGELTVVISEQIIKTQNIDEDKIVNKAKKYLKKYSLKDTVDLILNTENISKNKIYKLCLKARNEKKI